MLKTLIKVVVVLVIGLLTYNYFFGSPQEQETSRRVVGQVRDLGASVFDLLQSEQQKLSEGKYDEALATLKEAIGMEQEQAAALGHDGRECLEKCEHLQEQEFALEQQLRSIQSNTDMSEAEQAAALQGIHDDILRLTREAESLAHELRH